MRRVAPCARRADRHRDADGRARRDAAPRCRALDARRAVAVQGLPGAPAALGHEIARAALPDAARRRAVRARASRSRSRAASRPRWSRRAATQRCATPPSTRLHGASLRIYTSSRPGRRRGRRRGQERAGDRHRHRRRHGARPQRARRAGHARPGRDDAPRRRARRASRRPSWACRASATWCSRPPATCRATARSASRSLAARPLADDPGRARPRRRGRSQRADGAARAPQRAASRCRSSPPWSTCSTAGRSSPEQALEQLMRREARAGVVRAAHQTDAGVAVLAPGLEHGDRDRVAEVEAALAGAHRQAHASARRRSCRAAPAAGRSISAPKTSQSPGSQATVGESGRPPRS